jgi:putative ABC transport system permease protein
MIPISYNVRNLIVRKTTSGAAAGGLALVVFVLAAMVMLRHGINKALGLSGDPNTAMVLRKGADNELASSIDEPSIGVVLATPGVARASSGVPEGIGEILVVILLDKIGVNGFSNVQVRGVPDDVFKFRTEAHIVAGREAKPGTDEVIVGKAIAGRFKGVELGQSFELKKNRQVQVVGVFEAAGSSYESEVWADLHTIRTAFGREGVVSSVRAHLESPSKFDGFKAAVEENRQLNLEVSRDTEYFEKQSKGISILITALGVLMTFFLGIGAVIGAVITMLAAVDNRQREIGTLRALGFSRFSIMSSFLFESILLALAGAAAGAAGALMLGFVQFTMMNFQTWSEIVIGFHPNVTSIVAGVVFGAFMGILGGLIPAWRASRLSPIEAMRA